jgi:hypothetical protein
LKPTLALRSVSRITGVSGNTINKLMLDLGRAYSAYQDKVFSNLNAYSSISEQFGGQGQFV